MCTHIAGFLSPSPPLSFFLSLVCSRSLRSAPTLHSPYPTPTPAPRFMLGFPGMNRRDGRSSTFASFELDPCISEGRCGEQAKTFWLFCPGLCVPLGHSHLRYRPWFDILSRSRSRPTLLRGGTARTQGGHNLVVPTDLITMCLVVPVFRDSNYFSPLHAKRASASPHLSPLAPLFIHLPLSRSALHRSPGVDRDAILSLSIDHKSLFFWLRLIFRLLICALFVFGNRLLKTTHSHPHPHAVATLRTSGTISISRF